MKIIEKEFNVQTGEETITEREETASEKKLREKHQADVSTQVAEAQANAIAKSALLERLGISESEAKLLLS